MGGIAEKIVFLSTQLLLPAVPTSGRESQCCNQTSICCKRRLRVVVVLADIFEAIMPVRTSNHCSDDDIRVCLLTLLLFCTSFAPVLNTVIRDRCPSVMNMFGVFVSKTDNVRSSGFLPKM